MTKNKKCVICSRESDGGEFCRWHKRLQPIFSKKKGKKLKRKFKIEVRRRYLDYLPKILVLILLAIAVFFISGGLYNLVVRPPPILTAGDRIYFFIPYRLDEQLIGESLKFRSI
ncbi:MAG: hypothetical protein B6U77_00410 [Candidatus Hecatellales archaeon ex4484_218]|nr:MAG: hypothetical protein B6U77_00410 [Candidatus Hecatellales archaeon ex4484_218]